MCPLEGELTSSLPFSQPVSLVRNLRIQGANSLPEAAELGKR